MRARPTDLLAAMRVERPRAAREVGLHRRGIGLLQPCPAAGPQASGLRPQASGSASSAGALHRAAAASQAR
jgi:hypothetical protein